METLGDELVLLAILPNGVIGAAAKLRYGLSGSELIRLAALRRVGIERDRIVVLDQAPTGDIFLDEALASMHGSPTPKAWVARNQAASHAVTSARPAGALLEDVAVSLPGRSQVPGAAFCRLRHRQDIALGEAATVRSRRWV